MHQNKVLCGNGLFGEASQKTHNYVEGEVTGAVLADIEINV